MINVPALARLLGGIALVGPALFAASYYLREEAPAPAPPASVATPTPAKPAGPQPVVILPMPGSPPATASIAKPAPVAKPQPQPALPQSASAYQPPTPQPAIPQVRAVPKTPEPTLPKGALGSSPPAKQAEAKPLLTREADDDETPAVVSAGSAKGGAGCTHYKSYDPTTQTYRSFDGKTRECKPRR